MVVSAKHFAEVTNGYQQTTDGLWVHRGNVMAKGSYFDVGAVRVNANMGPTPNTGKGLEILYDVPSNTSYLQSIDRDASVYRPLTINASTVNLPDGSIGTSELADGAVTTAKLAAGAATVMPAWYISVPSWTTATTGAWQQTTITATGTFTGGLVIVLGHFTASHTAAGGAWYYGYGFDSALSYNMGLVASSSASMLRDCNILGWSQPPAGPHTFSMWIYNASAGTFSFNNQSYASLLCIELKR